MIQKRHCRSLAGLHDFAADDLPRWRVAPPLGAMALPSVAHGTSLGSAWQFPWWRMAPPLVAHGKLGAEDSELQPQIISPAFTT